MLISCCGSLFVSKLFFISVQMVGIGTSDVNLDKYRHTFCSLLGKDTDSWGLSYTGKINTTCHDVVVTAHNGYRSISGCFPFVRLVAP